MAELELKGVSLSFGGGLLLDGVDLALERGERVGLLGRNGAGKTSLLRVLAGELPPDEGRVVRRAGLRVAALAQEVPRARAGTVRELVRAALPAELDPWEAEKRVERELARFDLSPEAEAAHLSAGTVRRALLARALVSEPDLLVLDEPTNHLDLEVTLRLEELLVSRRGTLVFVTHDRAFLRRLSTRILDLDRGHLRSYACGYATYLERDAARLAAEEAADAEQDKRLAQEEVWIRKGIEARRTRNMGRVRRLEAMRKARGERRERAGRPKAALHEAERSGNLILRAQGLTHAFGERKIVRGLDFEVMRGDRVGLLGPNGCGKSTLLRLLLDELAPDAGSVRHGTRLEVGRFDQLREALDGERSVLENVCPGGDTVTVGGTTRHAISYLQDFLFTPDEARGPVARLSGGEQNRVQLARVLARPCNLLVLDEPTNDLDLPTLELLEELLDGYGGTLLLVSHDREFLDNVVTSTLAWEGPGRWTEYVGGYSDWLRQRPAPPEAAKRPAARPAPEAPRPRRLTFTEAHELERLPDRIEALERERDAVLARMAAPGFYKLARELQAAAREELRGAEGALAAAMARWEELESLR